MTMIQHGGQVPNRGQNPQIPLNQAGAGIDFQSLQSPDGPPGFQDSLPYLDLKPTWRSATQQGFALTIRSLRGGLNKQRDFLPAAHLRQAESTAVTHTFDQIILPWETESQEITLGPGGANYLNYLAHVHVFGREVMGSYLSTTLWAETSPSNPELTPVTVTPIDSLHAVKINGQERLVISNTVYSDVGVTSLGIIPLGLEAMIQVPLPGDPVQLRGGGLLYLAPNADLISGGTWITSDPMLTNLPNPCTALGMQRVGGGPPRAYWHDLWNAAGGYMRISSTNAYGTDYQVLETSMNGGIISVGTIRNGLALTDTRRVSFYDGRERPLRLFSDRKPVAGFFYYCAGVYIANNELFAECHLVPDALDVASDIFNFPNTFLPQVNTQRWIEKYDFDLDRWHNISEVTEWEPVATAGQWGRLTYGTGIIGPVTAWPRSGTLPWSKSTRNFHIGSALSAANPVKRKFQENASENPYGLRGGSRNYSAGAVARTPGLLLDGEGLYADKYLDEIDWGGVDSGGTGSSFTVRVADYGHLDDVDSYGNRTALHHTFLNGLPHASRRRKFPVNKSSMLTPQIEFEITRGNDHTLTLQGLPVTLYMHYDLPEHDQPEVQGFGRSKG